MKRFSAGTLLVVVAWASVALASPANPAPSQESTGETPPSSSWAPWLLVSASQFRAAPPPPPGSHRTRRELAELVRLQDDRTKRIRRQIRFWNEGAVTLRWTEVALEMVRKHRQRPPFAARLLALLHTAMADAVVAAEDSRAAYHRPPPARLDSRIRPLLRTAGTSYPPTASVIAGAAERVLTYVFPNEPDRTFDELADAATESRLWAGVNYRSDIETGRALGNQVGDLFVARGSEDGSSATGFPYGRSEGLEYWVPTPPAFEPPTGGPVAKWRPWILRSADEARLASGIEGPLVYGSDRFMAELDEVLDIAHTLSEDQRVVAEFWDDGLGTYTPPGHWNQIAVDLVRRGGVGTRQAARLFAYLNAAMYDGAIAVFEAKYYWWSIRPVTAVRRLCDGASRLCTPSELDPASGGDPSRASYPDWLPYIATPPFPSYPGGHSTFSGSAGAVLTHFFPGADGELNRLAEEAALSRLLGGIHFRVDNDHGLRLGRAVAAIALERAALEDAP